jgi:hypothetical protein
MCFRVPRKRAWDSSWRRVSIAGSALRKSAGELIAKRWEREQAGGRGTLGGEMLPQAGGHVSALSLSAPGPGAVRAAFDFSARTQCPTERLEYHRALCWPILYQTRNTTSAPAELFDREVVPFVASENHRELGKIARQIVPDRQRYEHRRQHPEQSASAAALTHAAAFGSLHQSGLQAHMIKRQSEHKSMVFFETYC